MLIWSKDFDLLTNRVEICNQLVFDKFLQVSYNRGVYVVSCSGAPVAQFGVYDVPGLARSLEMVDAWSNCLWHMSRSGRLSNNRV